jgi:hypothetical protein
MKARLIQLIVLLGLVLGATGCQHEDDPTVSQRPWNSPKGWENGLPQEMFEGR